MSKVELKSKKKQVRADFISLADELEDNIKYNLHTVSHVLEKRGRLADVLSKILFLCNQLEALYNEFHEIEQIAKIKKEEFACKEIYEEIHDKVDRWVRQQRDKDLSQTARKLAEFDSSGSEREEASHKLAKKCWTAKTSLKKDVKNMFTSAINSREDTNQVPLESTPVDGKSRRIRKLKVDKHVSFSLDGVSVIPHDTAIHAGAGDPEDPDSSSESSSEDSSEDEDKGPLLSRSDVMQGLGRLPNARTISSRRNTKKSSKRDKGIDTYMQRIQMPVFEGNDFLTWWSMFEALVDDVDQPTTIKFLRLKQSVKGEPYEMIKNFSHDKASYTQAKEMLYDMYGGLRRQNQRMYDDLDVTADVSEFDFVGMRKLLSMITRLIRQLEVTHQTGEIGPSRLHSEVISKLHPNTIFKYHDWLAMSEKDDNLYSVKLFLERHSSRGIVALESSSKGKQKVSKQKQKSKTFVAESGKPESVEIKSDKKIKSEVSGTSVQATDVTTSSNQGGGKRRCRYCKKPGHQVWKCNEFQDLDVKDRWDVVKSHHICYKCLSPAHNYKFCDKARNCGVNGCTIKHHKLLHDIDWEPKQSKSDDTNTNVSETKYSDKNTEVKTVADEKVSAVSVQEYNSRYISLGILPVMVSTPNGSVKVLAMVDSGSNASFLSSSIAEKLQLVGEKVQSTITSFGGRSEVQTNMVVEIMVTGLDGKKGMSEIVEIKKDVVGKIGVTNWAELQHRWPHLKDLELPSVSKNSKVDLLLGLNFLPVLIPEPGQTRSGPEGSPVAFKYPIGWVCMGPTNTTNTCSVNRFTCCGERVAADINLDKMVQKFWETEEPEVIGPKTKLDKQVEEQTRATLKPLNPGYEVGIPWVAGRPKRKNRSRQRAIKRLYQTEKKLLKHNNKLVAKDYCHMFTSYISKKYFREVLIDLHDDEDGCYIAHFPIIKYDRETTKVRPVYDASDDIEGYCINEFEHVGPKKQQSLLKVLLRFRRFCICFGCDISEMYLRIRLMIEDWKYQRVLWRDLQLDAPIKTYEMTRVMFGRKSSPFLALFVSQENAIRHQNQFPRAAETILESTYMDDSMDSTPEVAEALSLYQDLNLVWGEADMQPRKWFSNSVEFLSEIPVEDRAAKLDITALDSPIGKTLGVSYSPQEDAFTIITKSITELVNTKRLFLKHLAGIFDPLGFIAPYTIKGKIYFQLLWIEGFEWDEKLPDDLVEKLKGWFDGLVSMKNIAVKRTMFQRGYDLSLVYLHCLVDASLRAMGCGVYAIDMGMTPPESRFVTSKSKLAPVKSKTIPQLELQAAVLGVTVVEIVCEAVNYDIARVTFWSDSLDVIFWVKSISRLYKAYFANRIGRIQESTQPKQWFHIPTEINSADLVSRGCDGDTLPDNCFWYEGPEFLRQGKSKWPVQPKEVGTFNDAEKRKEMWTFASVIQVSGIHEPIVDLERINSWGKCIRILAYIYRFIKNTRDELKQDSKVLTVDEMEAAEMMLILQIQNDKWHCEMMQLQTGKEISSSSKLLKFLPWMDHFGIMRSETRLVNEPMLPWEEKYPIILPPDHFGTGLLIMEIHVRNYHAGIGFILSELRKRFTFDAMREKVKIIKNSCYWCKKQAATPLKQRMGPLPDIRTERTNLVFKNSAVDFAGPYYTKQGRGKAQEKRWLCLFTCLAVRAVHLELAMDMSSDSFLQCLDRFTARRGVPAVIHCDNGPNFRRTYTELAKMLDKWDQDELKLTLGIQRIEWRFMPAAAPHMGGAHEIMVKAAKRALKNVVGKADLTDYEMQTAFTLVEGFLNKRPLTYQTAAIDEKRSLTPDHFILGHMNVEIVPHRDYTVILQKRWVYIQELVDVVWDRWVDEWLRSIAVRRKWFKLYENLKEGDVVLVMDMANERGNYPMARVIKTYTGTDGLVRSADVETGQKRRYKRPIVKLVKLV